VDLSAHPIAQSPVDELVTLNEALSMEGRTHDECFEMLTVARDRDVLASQSRKNILSNLVWSGKHVRA
jgi:hypothetical protein